MVNGGSRSLIFVREKHFQADTDCPNAAAVTTRLYCSREMFPIPSIISVVYCQQAVDLGYGGFNLPAVFSAVRNVVHTRAPTRARTLKLHPVRILCPR